jgi:hypothetical protein
LANHEPGFAMPGSANPEFYHHSYAKNTMPLCLRGQYLPLKSYTIAKGISAVNSEAELRAYVASPPNAPALPAKFDAAFPVIKQGAIGRP